GEWPADDVLEAIYEAFPDRRPDSHQRSANDVLGAMWRSAEGVVARHGDLVIERHVDRLTGEFQHYSVGPYQGSVGGYATRVLERAKPEWVNAKVISGEQEGRTRYIVSIPPPTDSDQRWMLDSGVAYSDADVE